MLQVLERGRLVWVQRLGQHCWDDDAMLLANQAEAERRWQAEQVPLCQADSTLVTDVAVSAGSCLLPALFRESCAVRMQPLDLPNSFAVEH